MLLLVTRKGIAHAIAHRENFTSERMVRSYGLHQPRSGVPPIPLHESDDNVLRCFMLDGCLSNSERLYRAQPFRKRTLVHIAAQARGLQLCHRSVHLHWSRFRGQSRCLLSGLQPADVRTSSHSTPSISTVRQPLLFVLTSLTTPLSCSIRAPKNPLSTRSALGMRLKVSGDHLSSRPRSNMPEPLALTSRCSNPQHVTQSTSKLLRYSIWWTATTLSSSSVVAHRVYVMRRSLLRDSGREISRKA
jgi:hypothetical protein